MKNFKLWQGDLKRIFKKLLPIALSVTMAFSFVGCGKEKDKNGVVDNTNPPYTTPIDPTPSNPNNQTPADPTPSTPSTPTTPDKDKDEPSTPTTPDKDKDEPSTPTTPDKDKDEPTTPTDPNDNKDPDDQDPETPPVVEEFSLAENKDKIIENVMPIVNYYKLRMMGISATIDNIYDIFLEKSDNSQYINTIGVIFSGKTSKNDLYLEYGTIAIPVITNLTYQDLSKTEQTNIKNLSLARKYNFVMSGTESVKYKPTIQAIQQKLFDNYSHALWLGWTGTNSPQNDSHRVVCYDGKTIIEKNMTIKNDGCTLEFPSGAIEKYFTIGDYTTGVGATITLPTDTLLAQVQKELQEKEQQEI